VTSDRLDSRVGESSPSPRRVWCERFLTWLRERHGFSIGVDAYVDAERLLDRIGPSADSDQIARALCALIVKNEEEQARFLALFKRFDGQFEGDPKPDHPVGDPGSADGSTHSAGDRREPTRSHGKTIDPAARRTFWKRLWISGPAVAIILIAATVTFWKLGPCKPKPELGQGQDRSVDTTTVDTTFAPVMPEPILEAARLLLPPFTRVPWFRQRWVMHSGIALLAMGGATVWMMRRRLRDRKVLRHLHETRSPYFATLETPINAAALFVHDAFYRTSQILQRRQRSDDQAFSPRKSIAATIAGSGYPAFEYEPLTRPPEYLILIERRSPRDQLAAYFAGFAAALRTEGAHIETFFYEHDPRVCQPVQGGALVGIAELVRQHAQSRLLIVGSGQAFLHPFTGKLETWTRLLEDWNDRILLSTDSPRLRRVYDERLAEFFLVATASLAGLRGAANALDLGLDENPIEVDASAFMHELGDDPEIHALREALKEPVFRWLCACAVHAELQWELTLYLASLPSLGRKLLDEEPTLALASLEWFRLGRIPDSRRIALLDHLDPDVETEVRKSMLELLERNRAPKDSSADWQRQRQIQEQRIFLAQGRGPRHLRTRAKMPTLWLPDELPEVTPLGHLVRRSSSAFSRFLRGLLFEHGIPAFGPPPATLWTIAGVVVLGSLGSLWRSPTPAATVVSEAIAVLIAPGDSLRLRATAFLATGDTAHDARVTWRSSDPRVAFVRGDSMFALLPGEARLTASAGSARDTMVVIVSSSEPSIQSRAPIAHWVVPPRSLGISEMARVPYMEGDSATWSSCDASVASVSPSGVVLGTGRGSATLIAVGRHGVQAGFVYVEPPMTDTSGVLYDPPVPFVESEKRPDLWDVIRRRRAQHEPFRRLVITPTGPMMAGGAAGIDLVVPGDLREDVANGVDETCPVLPQALAPLLVRFQPRLVPITSSVDTAGGDDSTYRILPADTIPKLRGLRLRAAKEVRVGEIFDISVSTVPVDAEKELADSTATWIVPRSLELVVKAARRSRVRAITAGRTFVGVQLGGLRARQSLIVLESIAPDTCAPFSIFPESVVVAVWDTVSFRAVARSGDRMAGALSWAIEGGGLPKITSSNLFPGAPIAPTARPGTYVARLPGRVRILARCGGRFAFAVVVVQARMETQQAVPDSTSTQRGQSSGRASIIGPGGPEERFVRNTYQTLMGREPTVDEISEGFRFVSSTNRRMEWLRMLVTRPEAVRTVTDDDYRAIVTRLLVCRELRGAMEWMDEWSKARAAGSDTAAQRSAFFNLVAASREAQSARIRCVGPESTGAADK